MEIGSKEFKELVEGKINDKKKRHYCYDIVVKLAKQMGVHFYGDKPTELLESYRPNEIQEIRDYRLKIWKPVTKSLGDKVINTVNKILNPRYFSVEFPQEPVSRLVSKKEDLGFYMMQDYPIYKTFWHWLKETFIRSNFADPNAVICVLPKSFDVEETDMYKPLPYIYQSESVLDYKNGEYFLIYEEKESKYRSTKGYLTYIDRNTYYKARYEDGEFTELVNIDHNLNEVPAFFSGGVVNEKTKGYYYESFVDGVAAHWDRVVEMTSDKDGVIVNHLYPERYEYQTDCTSCNGNGHVHKKDFQIGPNVKGDKIRCDVCEGTGKITARSPYGAYTVSLNALNPDLQTPIPPVDYITKDLAPFDSLVEEIRKEKEAGFASINMEILNKVGENQSGIAKVIDRQDLDSFLMRVSSHVFDYIIPNVIRFTALWKYGSVAEKGAIEEYIDEIKINKPVEFNVLSVDALIKEYNNAKEVGANSNYLKNIESEIVNIKYSRNEEERIKNLTIIKLKPFPDKTIDDLMTAKGIGAIREQDLILNENIDYLVDTAIDENDEFLNISRSEQLQALYDIIKRDFVQEIAPMTPTEDSIPELEEEDEEKQIEIDEEDDGE